MSRQPELTEDDYFEIEEAIAGTARGRRFLRMRDARARTLAAEDFRRILREEHAEESAETNGRMQVRILREELREMSAYMVQTRREIAALKPAEEGDSKMMMATGELDAIVSATERATSDILSGVERIQELAARLPREGELGEIARGIDVQVTDVLTACSFQDITGQRTTKVVNTLRYIEQRVNSMIQIWGGEDAPPATATPADADSRPDAALMNGPALGGGPSQDEIDALFAEIDQKVPAIAVPASLPAAAAKCTSSQSEIDAMFG